MGLCTGWQPAGGEKGWSKRWMLLWQRRDAPCARKLTCRQTVLWGLSSPSNKKIQSLQLNGLRGNAAAPRVNQEFAFSRGSCRGWAPQQLSLNYQLQSNLLKCWLKAFGHPGLKVPGYMSMGAGLPMSFLDILNIACGLRELPYSCIWSYFPWTIPGSPLALSPHKSDL